MSESGYFYNNIGNNGNKNNNQRSNNNNNKHRATIQIPQLNSNTPMHVIISIMV